MKSDDLKKIISDCCNDITFSYLGKPSGVTSEVHDHKPTFQVWHGDDTKTYQDVDDLIEDKFYSGKSINDLAEVVEFNVA